MNQITVSLTNAKRSFVDSIARYLEQGGKRGSKRLLIKYLISVINL